MDLDEHNTLYVRFFMNNPLVSVIIPVYNKEEVIDRCLESIINQSYKNLEIIIIDDGSTDLSLNHIQKYSLVDDRINIISQLNAGPGAARNTGIINSHGDYLSFVDADDYLISSMIELLVKIAKQSDIVICGYQSFDLSGCLLSRVRINNTINTWIDLVETYYDDPIVGAAWNKLYSSRLIKNNGILFPTKQTWGEDLLFNIEAFEKAKSIDLIPNVLYNYSRTALSLSKTNDEKYSNNLIEYWGYKHNAYVALKKLLIHKNATIYQITKLKNLELYYIFSIIHLVVSKSNRKDAKRIINLIKNECDITWKDIYYLHLFPLKNKLRILLLTIPCSSLIYYLDSLFYSGYKTVHRIWR